ncbi:MAG: carboxypeptidase-like regulatory domain-containing protein [Bacteroidales bacterium]|nr:carboxypeptidase-like regulatory domain-containing protein [Bacteroidales bacterium]HPE86876.1 carboxypeptidase-like regulatory domain-containing protein [Bacteroidales bacterium]
MLKKLLLTLGIVLFTSVIVFAQDGTLKGQVLDAESKEPIPFANVVVMVDGIQKGGSATDFDGNYTIKPIVPGRYDVIATVVGYQPQQFNGVVMSADKITYQDFLLSSSAVNLDVVEIKEYSVPLISKDKTQSGGTLTSEEIAKMPNKSAGAVATTVGGVFSRDGEVGSLRGQRSSGTVYYIDGIRVTGNSNLPESAIDQVSVVLGGVPAQYGDATGGIISVTTKGPSRTFGMGMEARSSQFLDAYGYNYLGLNLNGPLLKSKKDDVALVGYFISSDLTYRQDSRPTAQGIYVANDDYLDYLIENPFRPSGTGFGAFYNSEFTQKEDLHLTKTTPNTNSFRTNIQGKFDFKTGPNVNLTIGGNYTYGMGNNYSFASSMFNSDRNGFYKEQTWRVFGRFTQRFQSDNENALISNIYYTIQADYTNYHYNSMDEMHQDDLFRYGYVGKFETYTVNSYELGYDTILGVNAFLHNGFRDTLVDFSWSDINAVLSNYTKAYYDLYEGTDGNYENLEQIVLGQGLINGNTPSAIYGLWTNPGVPQSGFGVTDNQKFGVSLKASADLGNHALNFGFQYEQRKNGYYSYAPINFWTVMRGLTNAHIGQLDVMNPIPVYRDGIFQDTINYHRIYDASSQRIFDANLRDKLGLNTDGTDYIDIDSYDPNTYTVNYYDADGKLHTGQLDGPLNVSMFSADEMLNNGNQLAGWAGYDYAGNRLTNKPSFDDFFTATDSEGNYTRPIGFFEPIYMAGYIQDIFSFKDLIFNVGVRVDRFDANQMVMKDPYLLYNARTVDEVTEFGSHPGNMEEDYIVYVDNVKSPTMITGYRNGNTWFDSEGIEISDPEAVLDAGTGVSPYLVDPNNQVVSSSAFEDYKPQLNIMPRISFSFPISDEALFFAHYDILTQRPTTAATISPTDYLFLSSRNSPTINNPNLQTEKTIDYELGFQQKLTNSSSLAISAFYREIRDQIQIYRFTAAYPKTYYSYTNLDFGTVKGLTVTYDLRRTNNARIRAAYTLQFANGTGSDPDAAAALVTSGQPNLRTLTPLDNDRRHAINLLLDYRWGEGKKYNGPVSVREKADGTIKSINWLENFGANVTVTGGSGTPYTKSSKIYPLGGSRVIKGSINGSRLPAQFRMDFRLDKDIKLTIGKEKKRSTYLNVYLQVLNLLDTENVMYVYPATGNPNDDGYLAAAEYQNQIAQQLDPEAYRALYELRINSPGNYSSPRQIRIGVMYNF